ncbi:type II toxin-antitoxin system Phd/YefM family antitoxin [Massilia endophytica]|uniref:type II toxin-antitoxin system Phd/YefM family antitoxin n=1 Tax=Massilia endophytica TaxID=2899220 RepID=UPI001E610CAE|nr:type II toxin-antitoxin system Phd/YefM family antitoxin [Massilia endophytica]UGQ47943.1 type II toxin-antitoxin system Phd/YefM family antitoxin [Massilia endophytica]
MHLLKMKPISYLKNNSAELAEELRTDQTDIVITQNGVAAFVCVPIERYESSRQALALLRLLNMSRQDYAEGRSAEATEVMDRIEKELFPDI